MRATGFASVFWKCERWVAPVARRATGVSADIRGCVITCDLCLVIFSQRALPLHPSIAQRRMRRLSIYRVVKEQFDFFDLLSQICNVLS
jgi:hypothetical protein